MNTFLQSVQNLDGEILLQIQQHLRTDMLTPLMKFVTFLGNGGWFWILCAVVLLAIPKTRKTGYAAVLSLIFGVIVTNLLLNGFFLPLRPHHSILCRCPGNASDAPQENRNPGSSPGSTGSIFKIISWCPLSNRCPGRVRGCADGKYGGCVDCEDEDGKSISLITEVYRMGLTESRKFPGNVCHFPRNFVSAL